MGMTNLEGPGKGGLYSRTGLMISPVEEDRVQNMETDVQLTTQHRLHLLQQNIQQFIQAAANQRGVEQSPEYGG